MSIGDLKGKILYISYDGLTTHIGQAQILPYIRGLAARGYGFSIISFERDLHCAKVGKLLQELQSLGIEWHPRQFRVSPPFISKFIDQMVLQTTVEIIVSKESYDIIHSRSYVAAVAGLRSSKRHGVPHIFDMRGFWVDQRVEGGRWPQANLFFRWLYRRWKSKERELIAGSSAIVVLTEAARRTLSELAADRDKDVTVIPCAYLHQPGNQPDEGRRVAARASLEICPGEVVLVYLGSLGSVYLLQEMILFYSRFRQRFSRTRFLFLGSTEWQLVQAAAKSIDVEIHEDEVIFLRCDADEVHLWLNAGDAAVCFITPTFSSRGVSPTKLAEYLAMGLPTVVNSQVGDVADIIAKIPGSGVVVDNFRVATLDQACESLACFMSGDRMAIREASQKIHDLPIAVDQFDHIYARLINTGQR